MMDFSGPLENLSEEKERTEKKGRQEIDEGCSVSSPLNGRDGEGHGKTAREKDERVQGACNAVQLAGSQMEVNRILVAIRGIENKQPSEEKDL